MKFKKRWVYKMLSWKVISTLLGFFAVWITAADITVGLGYLAIYVPASMVAFLLHEKAWYTWKVRNRCVHCRGMGVRMDWTSHAKECVPCDGTGDKRNGEI